MAARARRLYRDTELPAQARAVTLRILATVVHSAVDAAEHPVVEGIVRTHGSTGAVPVPGRSERLHAYPAALATGAAAHLGGDDDTGAACLAAGLSLGWQNRSPGRRFVHAAALGLEVQLRIGQTLCTDQSDAGRPVVATCGVIGAAVTGGLLTELDDAGLARAIGLAVSQASRHGAASGSAASALGVGKAAANGLLAALLARASFTAPDTALDGGRGFVPVLAPGAEPVDVLAGFGSVWHLLRVSARGRVRLGTRADPIADAVSDLSEASTLQPLIDAATPQRSDR
jgi:2-methylcitrate dehydratase PrpD